MLKIHAIVVEDIKDPKGNTWFSVGDEVLAIQRQDGRYTVKPLPNLKKYFSVDNVDKKHLRIELN